MAEALCIDIEGIIISPESEGSGLHLLAPGVCDALRQLREKKFGENIFILSRAGWQLESEIRWSLWKQNFYSLAGIIDTDTDEHLFFSIEDHRAAEFCKKHGVLHFVSRRMQLLEYLHQAGIPNLHLYLGEPEEIEPRKHLLPLVAQAHSWPEVVAKILG